MRQKRELPTSLPLQTRLAPISLSAIDAEARTVRVTFSTGAAVRRLRYNGWDSPGVPFDEILVVSRDAVDLTRMNDGAPVLDSHFMYALDGVRGVVKRAWIEGRGKNAEARAELQLDPEGVDENTDRLFAKIAAGTIRNVSVGYIINEVRVVEANEKKSIAEQHFVERWTPYEVSFVTIGADPKAQVRAADESDKFPIAFTIEDRAEDAQTGATAMDRETQITELCKRYGFADKAQDYISGSLSVAAVEAELKDAAAKRQQPNPAPTPQPAAARQAEIDAAANAAAASAIAAERQRITDITQAVRDFGMSETEGNAEIAAGTAIADVRAKFQAKLAERNRNAAPHLRPITGVVRNGLEERETRINLVGSALAHRLRSSTTLEAGAEYYRGRTMIELAADFLEAEGVKTRGLSKMEIATLATQPGGNLLAERAGLHSVSDFPIVLGNQVNRTLREAYAAQPTTFQRIARRSIATDFRPIIRAQIGDAPKLQLVNESGEFRYGSVGEGSESYKVLTYGRILGLTRQALINDDLGAFDRIPQTWGRSAARLQNEIVWALITDNGPMSDGKNLFSADHGNLADNDESPTPVSVAAGRHAIRMQKGIAAPAGSASGSEDAGLIGQEATILAAPSGLELVVLQFLSPIVVPTTDGAVNPFKGLLQPLIEPLLDLNSPLSWYLFVGGDQPTAPVEYAFLDGNEGVYTETRIGFEVDGVEFKVRLDFGAGVQDFHGAYKNAGEAASG
jgi:Mu-like prophage major head subunit gpT